MSTKRDMAKDYDSYAPAGVAHKIGDSLWDNREA
jgi:hypothetical protein